MNEIRLVGRGGQGIVTAGELLGQAAVFEGRWAQALPTFGPERRGALSQCTVRLDDEEILHKHSMAQPDLVVSCDPTIWQAYNVLLGIRESATLVFNTPLPLGELEADLRSGKRPSQLCLDKCRIFAVDATGIALEILKRPITNTAMLGALSAATGLVQMDAIEKAFEGRFGKNAGINAAAAHAAAKQLQQLN